MKMISRILSAGLLASVMVVAIACRASKTDVGGVPQNSQDVFERLQKQLGDLLSCRQDPEGRSCVIEKNSSIGYSEAIGILFPRTGEGGSPSQEIKLALYLHGFRGVCDSRSLDVRGMMRLNQMHSQLSKASNTILVFPLSRGRNDQHNSSFAPQFDSIARKLEAALGLKNPKWALFGHSGAYRPLTTILQRSSVGILSRVSKVGLIDATYSSSILPALKRLVSLNQKASVEVTYLPGTKTQAVAIEIQNSRFLPNRSVKSSAGQSHCEAPKKDLAGMLM